MADPSEPDCEFFDFTCPSCDSSVEVDIDDMRAAIAPHGLHLITNADRAVLDAIAEITKNDLAAYAACHSPWFLTAQAERARREKP